MKNTQTGQLNVTQMYRNLLFDYPQDLQLAAFYNIPPGQLYQAIPFDLFIKDIKAPHYAVRGKGCKPWFDVKDGIALQLLKACYRLCNAMPFEQLNGNWQMQMFCGIQLKHNKQIKDKDIVGRWRSFLAKQLDMDKLQMSCVQYWRPFMQEVHAGFCDDAVFESYIEYPHGCKASVEGVR